MRGNNHAPQRMSTAPGHPHKQKGAPLRKRPLWSVLGRDQFLDLSTILPAEIQGIMARSCSPTFSI